MRKRRALVGVAVALAACPATAGAATVTEFSAGITPNSQPADVAPGPDGNLWFTEAFGHRIGRITPAGAVTEFSTGLTPSSEPRDITPGPDGNLWFTERAGGRIGRISATAPFAGTITEFPLPMGGSPFGITGGPDGNLWFVEEIGNRVGRITPTGTITEFTVPGAGSQPQGITAGPDGNLWFTQASANQIGRITPDGAIVEFAVPGANSQPFGITAGPDGNVWFTQANVNQIGRITPAGAITEFTIPTVNSVPTGIAVGADGNLWFSETGANKVGRITPSGTITEFGAANGLSANSGVAGITGGPDGNLWFAQPGNPARIGRITTDVPAPSSGNLLRNPGAEQGVAVDGGAFGVLRTTPLVGWATTPNMTPMAYGASVDFPSPGESARIGGGNAFFVGGPFNVRSQALQRVDVSAHAAAIDAGRVKATVSGQLGGKTTDTDTATVFARPLSAAGALSGAQAALGPVGPADRNNQTRFVERTSTVQLPGGTRSIQVAAVAERNNGNYNDASFDNLSLTLDIAPAPASDGGGSATSGGTTGSTTTMPAPDPSPISPAAARCTLTAKTRVTANKLTATVTCDRAARLAGTATLIRTAPKRRRGSRRRPATPKPITLSTASANAVAGRSTPLTLTLRRAGLAAVKAAIKTRRRYTVRVALTATTADGARSTATRTLSRLTLPKAKKRRRG